jgi:S1-C subfamily serine protease
MMEEGKDSNRRFLAALVVVLLLISTISLYYNLFLTRELNSSNETITSLQDQISSLETGALRSQGGLIGGLNSSIPVSGSQSIYLADYKGVVTVQGAVSTTTETIFGPVTTITTVLGSGFVVDYNGSYYVITNYHVVNGVTNLTVTFWDGDAYPATPVGTDRFSDLAVVSVQAPSSEFSPLTVVSSDSLVVGDPVYVIGNPYGLSGSFTFGIVSALGRTITESTTNNFLISGVVQFSAPINPGNSGGPLIDVNGSVVGITTAEVSGSQGVGFAIPSSTIIKELPFLIETGSYKGHSYLGIAGVDMNYQLAQACGTNVTYGVLVEAVSSGSPADKAGLKGGSTQVNIEGTQYLVGGDIIISVNGVKVINQDALSSYLTEYTVAGQTVQLGLIRSGNFMTLNVTLGSLPGS